MPDVGSIWFKRLNQKKPKRSFRLKQKAEYILGTGFEPRTPWSEGKHANNYPTEL